MKFANQPVEQFVQARYRDHPDEQEHVYDLAAMARSEDDFVVALLHDLVEDEFATWAEIETLLAEDAERLIPALRLLTRGEEPYDDYIESIATSGNIIAMNVKTLDLFDHLSPYKRATLPMKNVIRYFEALERLTMVSFETGGD
jgi:hypothetical protein